MDISDLETDPIVMWQSRHFLLLAIVMGWVVPTVAVGIVFQDWRAGFMYGAIGKIILLHQSTFLINSLAHYMGDRPYGDKSTSRDNLLVALLTLGEGYHNFHHTFPYDYRNGIRWYHYDCTKWAIALWQKAGLAHNLKTAKESEIARAREINALPHNDESFYGLPTTTGRHTSGWLSVAETWLSSNALSTMLANSSPSILGGSDSSGR
ncbi:hypothetical protein EYZ11_012479 [Aspergillus tanneri]|uniref:Fatty acid desaturase domain-containing protein n=1 Tax=Aspergillus tanneri TaxID=1220188 RepID=A0A4S3J293_9EURO|nr:uncharacterized protein ATNIH1004_000085 [Aspergillus tanneri]KAA8651207.1 hypothetical protein ATNIH1004_000085 [Aspergillus tanneri]THC88078.1 hypothetical protein EYZ11_012479 [Aspergillus tanneri]